ncbi:response regulator [Colwellia echini]|uniref:histidine kinase n=1 Tax=Colwellia echini TaxID=1982103 RepID=A0ABY3MV60_9GAMM|nr:response regulator [Colwellia echini]TYK65091.1 response regulator [Colwellia echini]
MLDKNARVLLVEDDEDDYILTSDYLSQLDSHVFEIDWVTSPDKALEQLQLGKHDICLLDYQLGAYNGLTVLEKASQSGCSTPIIMLTGQSDETIDKAALAAGAVDYLAKSEITTARFARAIRYALARQEIENERVERINAEARNQSKDRFLAHLSHELRTPLTSILGYTEILLNGDKAPDAKPELNIILNNGQHLLGLLNNVLDLSKIAVGKLEYNSAEISLDSFIADIVSLMKVHASEKSLPLHLDRDSLLPEKIYADPVRLRQVLINLIHNAIKFTDKGLVSLSMWTEVINEQELLHFKVSDTGEGIPELMLETIFNPFEQVEDVVSRKEQGAGLGLSICSELVKQMGGAIYVKSELGKGSDFIFTINPGDISKQTRGLLTFKNDSDELGSCCKELSQPQLTGRVLIVEDMDDIRQLIGQICLSFGLDVHYAANGLQAIEEYKQTQLNDTPFDLILMDIHMPELDGKRTIKVLKTLGFDNPIIAITAATMKGVKQELLGLGFNQIIAKPINKNELYRNLTEHLTLTPAHDSEASNSEKLTHSASFPPNAPIETNLNLDSTVENITSNVKQKIMVVEDDEDAADVTLLLLESIGATAVKAENAQQCLELLKTDNHWTKILLDLHLPDSNGLDLALTIQHSHPNIELIIVSGENVSEQNLKKAGINRAILKPVNLQILNSLL